MERTSNIYNKIGAIFFIIWGIVHVLVGAIPVIKYFVQGPVGIFAGNEMAVSANEIGARLQQVANILVEYRADIFAFGVLAIIVAATLNWKNKALGFWINTAVLGIVDIAFVFAQLIPGYQPLLPPVLGPVIYVLAVGFSAAGLLRGQSEAYAQES
ncbi:MAG: hypothetical protein K9N46_01010 [Candidatus Marinimicrobia bacterium]|nr:hypothetical protein [Candidatus Neomarinimicrobiota bacterium]MCF7827944.1 hypothetical protein [Candidatus Neomarinimicrobiota bacterium]MCF7879301.1 hypothetical protein [Candidatus Neomarinimicrobiota bacterium]